MDFVFGLPRDSRRKTGIVVFVDRFSKMVHLAAVAAEVTSIQTARLFVDMVFKHHGMPSDFVSDRDPRFTARFWQEVFTLLGTRFSMSTADHPQTDGQTERVNRVLVDLLKSYAQSFHNWRDYLPMVEFAINNAKTADTDLSAAMTRARARPAYDKATCQCRALPLKNHEKATPASAKDNVSVQGTDNEKTHAQAGPGTDADKTNELDPGFSSQAMDFVHERQAVVRFVQDAIAASADRQKLNADNVGRG
ncbi:reverse transcriptase [Phytophthora megakarya]|uniref:Reverse transcriptase n=1 Tax=Phytophthora megakarya TaxID=4795 RepID=A0A225VGG4_9STRA|nr:reverse transcriptase [Phytophthora megakarya]